MPFRSKHSTDTSDHSDVLTSEEPVVAGRLEWVTAATRDQLADVSARSKSLAGTARTRVTPLKDLPGRRFGVLREEQVVVAPPVEEGKSSTPWLLIAIIAAVASAIVAIAVQRARQHAEDEYAFDLMMEQEALAPETPLMHNPDAYDGFATNPS